MIWVGFYLPWFQHFHGYYGAWLYTCLWLFVVSIYVQMHDG